jgi:hypothetical protein
MRPKALVAAATVAAALSMTVPAFASAKAHHALRLNMGGRVLHKAGNGLAAIAGASPSGSIVAHKGFSCGVVVAQGADGSTLRHYHTNASSEFYVPFGTNEASVTTTCIGTLPPNAVPPTKAVANVTANCGQINPLHPKQFISGFGVTITFPSGLYAETCNTSAFGLL